MSDQQEVPQDNKGHCCSFLHTREVGNTERFLTINYDKISELSSGKYTSSGDLLAQSSLLAFHQTCDLR